MNVNLGSPSASFTMFVDMLYVVTIQIETHTQETRTQHTMKVGNSSKLLGCQTTIQGIESFDAMIFSFKVSFHESDIGCQILKERTCKATT